MMRSAMDDISYWGVPVHAERCSGRQSSGKASKHLRHMTFLERASKGRAWLRDRVAKVPLSLRFVR